jgi:hypothetical protein
MKTRYKFSHRGGDKYYWISILPIARDSRHEQISCSVEWFWKDSCETGD